MSALLSSIKDHHSERRLFISRVILASVVSVLLIAIVVARLVQLQIVDHALFAEKSQGNRVRIEPVPPIRGLIFDRKGRVIAENLPAYQLELIPEQVDDLDDTLTQLAALGLIAAEDIPKFKELSRSGPRFKPVTLKVRLTDEEIAHRGRLWRVVQGSHHYKVDVEDRRIDRPEPHRYRARFTDYRAVGGNDELSLEVWEGGMGHFSFAITRTAKRSRTPLATSAPSAPTTCSGWNRRATPAVHTRARPASKTVTRATCTAMRVTAT